MLRASTLLVLFVGVSGTAATEAAPPSATVQILSQRQETYSRGLGCIFDGTCSLQSAQFIELVKNVELEAFDAEAHLMTDMRLAYQTSAPDELEQYAVVQMLRGCEFDSTFDGHSTMKELTISRSYFGRIVPFQHRTWNVDADDSNDPIYSSTRGRSRFDLLRWNLNPQSLDPETAEFYGVKKPTFPKVFVTDLLASAFVTAADSSHHQIANNSSLEFRTCLFKTSDLPAATDPVGSNLDFSAAIVCFHWEHKFVYDFTQKKFISGGAIDPICGVSAP